MDSMTKTIRIADFARSPGGRFVSDGPFSGEWFRDSILAPELGKAIATNDRLEVVLDGTSGYGSSFLEEAFGGLVRKGIFPRDVLVRSLVLTALHPVFAPYRTL